MSATTTVLYNAQIAYGPWDFSGQYNMVGLDYGADGLDNTAFGSVASPTTTRTKRAGMKTVKVSEAGYFQANSVVPVAVNDALFASVGGAERVLTLSPDGVVGGVAWSHLVTEAKYAPGGKVGDLLAFSADFEASNSPLVQGILFLSGAKTVTGTSAIVNLGAVTSGQRLYAALHVFAPVAGTSPTLDVTVKSAALVGFGSPTTRITFAQQVGANAVWGTSVAGPITDAFYRVDYVVGGTGSPSFPVLVVVGIL